jgi:hypothetical protein
MVGSATILELQDGVARLLRSGPGGERTCEREIPVGALLDWLAERAVAARGFETHLLAPGTRYIRALGRKTVLVLEEPPRRRRVIWVNGGDNPGLPEDASIPRWLAFPYVVIVLSFEDGEGDGYHQLYYRTTPLDSLDAPLLHANLLNVTTGRDSPAHWLCLGQEPLASLDWPEKVQQALHTLWATPFNFDFEVPRGSGFTRLRTLDPRIVSGAVWERASEVDPLFPLQVNWPPAGLTLREAVAESLASIRPPVFPRDVESVADAVYRL